MNTAELKQFFEDNDFLVYPFEQDGEECAEVEKWTDGGVDMIILLRPFAPASFKSYVDDFDVDELIELHRQAKDYKSAFTIKQSLRDFEDFHKHLKEVAKKIK